MEIHVGWETCPTSRCSGEGSQGMASRFGVLPTAALRCLYRDCDGGLLGREKPWELHTGYAEALKAKQTLIWIPALPAHAAKDLGLFI